MTVGFSAGNAVVLQCLMRPPDVCRSPSKMLLSFFATRSLQLSQTAERPHRQKYITGYVLGVHEKFSQTFRLPLPYILHGRVKSAKFGFNFQLQLSLRCSGFKAEQHIWYLKLSFGAQIIRLCCLQIWQSSLYPTLRTVAHWDPQK